MILFPRSRATSGIFFAIWPRRTPEGLAVGWLHWEYVESWGWGSDGYYRYTNWVPEKEYNEGKRAQAKFYSTPPGDPKTFCKNYRTDGPTPCHYPNCKMLDAHGDERCAVDNMKFGEW